ncbi:MAG TPA: acetyl-CoA carboxylase biotin carboxylase subunit [Methylomirabilota bacterium]|nr:acetyl-CoA carboxylase biotin carboxylase subunit [Methylomirabilota bacterium]
MFQKILIANRGEIALRILRTCREMGIRAVVAHSTADADSLPVRQADGSICIGPAEARSSYLNVPAIISAAAITDSEAIHPGYGLLSENPAFAEICRACGITFIGPSPEAIRLMGDKAQARQMAKQAGAPVVPGSKGPLDSLEQAQALADEIGYPVIVKAAAGGGGRGMRIVREPDMLARAFTTCQAEAVAAFGSSELYLEKFIEEARHVEVQVLGDRSGIRVHLGERDCSVQRRHQKLLEESPAPALSRETRAGLCKAALAVANAVNYVSAGTVEFLVDRSGRFYFIEMNTRIQVEHPVTELVTGVDLVAEQLRIANRERLDVDVTLTGHAVEVRLYAEDPRSFLPQAGRLERLRLPHGIRVDAGVEEGDEVGVAYDPMIAKLIAHGPTRDEAFARLHDALAETEVAGVVTNLPFLRWLVSHPAVLAGRTTTAFLTDFPPLAEPPLRLPTGPWDGAWRLNLPSPPPHSPPDVDEAARGSRSGDGAEQSALTAPMPGTVIRVLAKEGDRVEHRQPLLVLEAMKMETPVVSPYEAVVRSVHVAEGDRVAGGAVLVELEE